MLEAEASHNAGLSHDRFTIVRNLLHDVILLYINRIKKVLGAGFDIQCVCVGVRILHYRCLMECSQVEVFPGPKPVVA